MASAESAEPTPAANSMEALIARVRALRVGAPDRTAAELHADIVATGDDVSLPDVKKACSKLAKLLAKEARQCARPSCTAVGTKHCSQCSSVFYCSNECQKEHWAVHKVVCRYIVANREAKGDKRELVIKPWADAADEHRDPHEVSAERDADFERYEKCFEKEIAECARTGFERDGAGLVVVSLKQQARPLDMKFVPRDKLNTKGFPNLSCTDEFEDEMRAADKYVVLATWRSTKEWPKGNKTARDRDFWWCTPVNAFTYGGRGSTRYRGPPGVQEFADAYGKDAAQRILEIMRSRQ